MSDEPLDAPHDPNAKLSVSLPSMSGTAIVRTISRLVYEHCQSLTQDADVASRFQMAAQELTENVVKYSAGPVVQIEVDIDDRDSQRRLCVRASNEATEEQLREVERRMHEIASAEDPVVLYERLIRESAPHRDVSGLGLVRLRAEGSFTVEHAVEGRLLTISAWMNLPPRMGE